MKRLYFYALIVLSIICNSNCSGQPSKMEIITLYKYQFLIACTQPFVIDTGWRDDVCVWIFDTQYFLDQKSYLEIESMSSLVKDLIITEVEETTLQPYNGAINPPSRECVIKSCLDQYESKDMSKMAKNAYRRIKKMTFEELLRSHQ